MLNFDKLNIFNKNTNTENNSKPCLNYATAKDLVRIPKQDCFKKNNFIKNINSDGTVIEKMISPSNKIIVRNKQESQVPVNEQTINEVRTLLTNQKVNGYQRFPEEEIQKMVDLFKESPDLIYQFAKTPQTGYVNSEYVQTLYDISQENPEIATKLIEQNFVREGIEFIKQSIELDKDITSKILNSERQTSKDTSINSQEAIYRLVNLGHKQPELLDKILNNKTKNGEFAFTKKSIINSAFFYEQEPELTVKLLDTDEDGNFKLNSKQIRSMRMLYHTNPGLLTEDMIDSYMMFCSKGADINTDNLKTYDQVDALSIMANELKNIPNGHYMSQYYDIEGYLNNVLKMVNSHKDVELINKALTNYDTVNEKEDTLEALAFINDAHDDNKQFVKDVVSELLDKEFVDGYNQQPHGINAYDLADTVEYLKNVDLMKIDMPFFLKGLKDFNDLPSILLATKTNDIEIINKLKNKDYLADYINENNSDLFKDDNFLKMIETVFDNNNFLWQEDRKNFMEFISEHKDTNLANAAQMYYEYKNSGMNSSKKADSIAYLVNSKLNAQEPVNEVTEAQTIQMLENLVSDKIVGKHVLHYLPKEGHLNPLIADDINLLYDLHKLGLKVEDYLVPKFDSLKDASDNRQTGDVFEVDGQKNIYIINEDGTSTQLGFDKPTYLKLFPPVERYASTQNAIGNCWEITGFNTLLRSPENRSKVLQCFKQDGKDIIVSFPKGGEYRFKNGQLPSSANKHYYSEGALGLNLLEYADGKEIHKERMKEYTDELKWRIRSPFNDTEQQKNYQKELDDILYMSEEERNKIYLDACGHKKNPTKDGKGDGEAKAFDGASTYARKGGTLYDVFARLGYDDYHEMSFRTQRRDAIDFLTNPKSFKDCVVTYSPKNRKTERENGSEKEVNKEKGLYSDHAYMLRPNYNKDGKIKDYQVLNPWGILETKLSLEELVNYGSEIAYANRIFNEEDEKRISDLLNLG